MYCPHCGHRIAKRSSFCQYCGEQLFKEYDSYYGYEQKSSVQNKNKKFIWLVVLICLLLGGGGLFGFFKYKEMTTRLDYDALSKSVMMLECYDINGEPYCTGSGCLVLYDNVIITNYHVISEDCYSVKAISDDGAEFNVISVIAYDEAKDIAILQLDRSTGIKQLQIGDSTVLKRGDKVIAIGSPMGLINTVSEGIISGFAEDGDIEAIQTTAPISSGSSGGALLNEKGELVGITYAIYKEGQNIGFAIPTYEIQNVWNTGKVDVDIKDFYNLHEHQNLYDNESEEGNLITCTVAEVLNKDVDVSYIDFNLCGYVAARIGSRFWLVQNITEITDVYYLQGSTDDYLAASMKLRDVLSTNSIEINTNTLSGWKSIAIGDYVEIEGTFGDDMEHNCSLFFGHKCKIVS